MMCWSLSPESAKRVDQSGKKKHGDVRRRTRRSASLPSPAVRFQEAKHEGPSVNAPINVEDILTPGPSYNSNRRIAMKFEILTSARRNSAVTDKCAMGVMIKTPRNGFSKTRLSPPLSSEEAANISRCFLKDTSATIEALSQEDPFVVGVAIYTPLGSEADLGELLPPGFKMIAQREGGFGTRLLGATEDLFSVGFSAVCLIDSDSPTLPFHCLRDLSIFLKEPKDRMVIGPCWDGGYYLLGLRHAHARLFEDITWNTDRVYAETVERSKEINLPAITLPAWYDVDDQLSLDRLLSELFPERANNEVPQGAPALHTKEFLRQILAGEGTGRIWPQASHSARTA